MRGRLEVLTDAIEPRAEGNNSLTRIRRGAQWRGVNVVVGLQPVCGWCPVGYLNGSVVAYFRVPWTCCALQAFPYEVCLCCYLVLAAAVRFLVWRFEPGACDFLWHPCLCAYFVLVSGWGVAALAAAVYRSVR